MTPLRPQEEYSEYTDQYVNWNSLINELKGCINAAGAVNVTTRAQYEDNWRGANKAIADLRQAIALLQVPATTPTPTPDAATWGQITGTLSNQTDLQSSLTNLQNSVNNRIVNSLTTDTLIGRASAGTGAAELISCTSAGRNLIDDLDASAQRETLELGNSAVLDVGSTANTVAAGDDVRFNLQNNQKLVQFLNFQTGAVATGTGIFSYNDTIPTQTGGNQFMSLSITPSSPNNILWIVCTLYLHSSVAGQMIVALFQDSVSNAIASIASRHDSNQGEYATNFSHRMIAGTTNPISFRVRAGMGSTATTTFNGGSGTRRYGGTLASSINILEYAP